MELDDKGDERENQRGDSGHRPIFAEFTFRGHLHPDGPDPDGLHAGFNRIALSEE